MIPIIERIVNSLEVLLQGPSVGANKEVTDQGINQAEAYRVTISERAMRMFRERVRRVNPIPPVQPCVYDQSGRVRKYMREPTEHSGFRTKSVVRKREGREYIVDIQEITEHGQRVSYYV